jgi:hypothetical protein
MQTQTHLGFTGTRHALTAWQMHMIDTLIRYHRMLGFTYFHAGDCVSADDFAMRTAYNHGFRVICHPPIRTTLRAYAPCHEMRMTKDYLTRNNEIVAESHAGIGVPNIEVTSVTGACNLAGSGTWYTINRMIEARLPHWIVTPTTAYCSELARSSALRIGN